MVAKMDCRMVNGSVILVWAINPKRFPDFLTCLMPLPILTQWRTGSNGIGRCPMQVANTGNCKIGRLISYNVAGVVVWVDNFKGGGCL